MPTSAHRSLPPVAGRRERPPAPGLPPGADADAPSTCVPVDADRATTFFRGTGFGGPEPSPNDSHGWVRPGSPTPGAAQLQTPAATTARSAARSPADTLPP